MIAYFAPERVTFVRGTLFDGAPFLAPPCALYSTIGKGMDVFFNLFLCVFRYASIDFFIVVLMKILEEIKRFHQVVKNKTLE